MKKTDTKDLQAVIPLSPMQEGMLFHSIHEPDSGMYIEQSVCRITGTLNISCFKKAWMELIKRDMAFRTSFVWKNTARILQVVHLTAELPFAFYDWKQCTSAEKQRKMDDLLIADRKAGFNLNKPPLIRLTLIQTEEDEYNFILTNHHIILDGWSLAIVINDFVRFYDHSVKDIPLPAAVHKAEFSDFIKWLSKQDSQKAQDFWKSRLSGMQPAARMSDVTEISHSLSQSDCMGMEKVTLSDEETRGLIKFVKENHLTLNTVLLGAWGLLLSRYLLREDVTFGYTVSGRGASLAGIEEITGNLINTLPLRLILNPDCTILQLLRYISRELIDIKDYEYTPLYQIQEWAGLKAGELFDNIVVFENYPVSSLSDLKLSGASINDFNHFARTNYPLTLVSGPSDCLPLMISFDRRYYSTELIKMLLNRLRYILINIAASAEIPVSRFSLVSNNEKETILSGWNQPVNYSSSRSIPEVFEYIAATCPENTAVWYAGRTLTYGSLNSLADQLALRLLKEGLTNQKPVGIYADRSALMIISMLAVLKTGAPYLPLSPEYPDDRLDFMIKDSGIEYVITTKELLPHIPAGAYNIIVADAEQELSNAETRQSLMPAVKADAGDYSYIIYTSGSTGTPKGTVLSHRGLVNVVKQLTESLNIDSGSRILQYSSFSFDSSAAEIFLALLNGASVYLIEREILFSPGKLSEFISENAIDTLIAPPALLSTLNASEFSSLKSVVSAGEACSWELVKNWQPGRSFFNGYGPTETTIGCCWQKVESPHSGMTRVPIGKPIGNVTLYVLDRFLNLVPAGFPGELYIGGIGVGYGYIGRPEITAERFIPDPFSTSGGERLYKSGDLVRALEDGTIDYLGRIDNQVKLRGFRIEPGEIEAELLKYPGIKQARVFPVRNSSGDQQLNSYLISDNGRLCDADTIRNFLKSNLPHFMIPSEFIWLKEFPLTPNGKIDKAALTSLTPEEDNEEHGSAGTQASELLCVLIAKLLNRKSVKPTDNFFDLGGHSLKSVQLASKIKEVFGVSISVKDIFNSQSINAIAGKVRAARESSSCIPSAITAFRSDGSSTPDIYDLSFSQQRLWFLSKLAPGSSYYNVAAAFRITGEQFEAAVLADCINEIIMRHQILRTVFKEQKGVPKQKVLSSCLIKIPVLDISAMSAEDQKAEIDRILADESKTAFDLEVWPLLRLSIIELSSNERILSLCMHHIITDGWSMGVLSNELGILYNSKIRGAVPVLPPLDIQYCDYSAWQRNCMNNKNTGQHIEYWMKELSGISPLLELPLDKLRTVHRSFSGAVEKSVIKKETRTEIEALNRMHGLTSFMTLLAVFQTLLYRYTMNSNIVVGIPVANRDRKEMENLIGFFVNTLAVKLHFADNISISEILKQVRQKTLEAFEHQDVPFDLIIEKLQPDRNAGYSPVFQTAFVYQNLELQAPQLHGLSVSIQDARFQTAKYDITLEVIEKSDYYELLWNYSTDLFEAATIRRLSRCYEALLSEILRSPAQKASEIRIIPEDEASMQLDAWNATSFPYPNEICIHQWFEDTVSRYRGKTALTFYNTDGNSSAISYDELNKMANKIARCLRDNGIKCEDVVAISAERSFSMIACLFGILKAGAAFLPVDPEYPPERISFMLSDSNAKVILTQAALVQKFRNFDGPVICVDAEWPSIDCRDDSTVPNTADPDNMAYIIYTSGSTGRPKGTIIQHRGICNLAETHRTQLGICEKDNVFQFSNLSFDAAVWDIIMGLLHGSTLCLAPRSIMSSGELLTKALTASCATTVTLPPSVLSVLQAERSGNPVLPGLRRIIAAGEKCSVELAGKWSDGRVFINAYGPTETTVCASFEVVSGSPENSIPIGKPILNFRLYVLDRNMQPVPVGVPGELYISGCGLARGYLNRPDITALKFIPNPFGSIPGERLYRTGDLVKWRADGKIEFIDRIDYQIKIRGFRVELEEITAVLMKYPSVNNAVVVTRDNPSGHKQLAAYINLINGKARNAADIRGFLKNYLPDYMIPSVFVFVDCFPLTTSGKIDKKALLCENYDSESRSEFLAPRNSTEKMLVSILRELLNVEKVSVLDSFFELGGHSLIAARYIAMIKEELNVDVPLQMLFQLPQIADLAAKIDELLLTGRISNSVQKAAEMKNGDVAELLETIRDLSDEEALELLMRENKQTKNGDEIE